MKYQTYRFKDILVVVLLASATQLWIVLILIIAVFKSCLSAKPNPIDDDVNSKPRLVDIINVVDSTHNGFRITYATEHSVSNLRADEIRSRPHITAGFNRLKIEAPAHFGSLLHTDIYDFADFAKKYDMDAEVRMNTIFVSGKEKSELYIGPNPRMDNPARWINYNTEQGIQYIKKDDIYYRGKNGEKVYRYWQCIGMDATSSTDEHFSHFSEEERLW